MSRLLLISLTALATVSFTPAAQAQMRTIPDEPTETNEILSPNDNSPVNVVDPGAETSTEADTTDPTTEPTVILSPNSRSPINVINLDAASIDGGTRPPVVTIPGREENRTLEGNTILVPDDDSPLNVVNPGFLTNNREYLGVGGPIDDDADVVVVDDDDVVVVDDGDIFVVDEDGDNDVVADVDVDLDLDDDDDYVVNSVQALRLYFLDDRDY